MNVQYNNIINNAIHKISKFFKNFESLNRCYKKVHVKLYLTGDTRKIFVSNIRPSTSPTQRAS